MADALLQTLTIKLNAEVGNTKKKLSDVATSVEKLEDIGKKADWSIFEQIRTNLEGIAKIDFSNVANSLKDVVSAMKTLGISAKTVKDMPVMEAPKMEGNKSLSAQEGDWNLPNVSEKTSQAVYTIAQAFDTATQSVSSFSQATTTFSSSAQVIAESSGTNVTAFTTAEKKANDYQVALTKLKDTGGILGEILKDVGKNAKKAGDNASNSAKGFKKMINSIKRITFYRLVRRAIQLIGQALTEGIQKMATFDSDFNASMSEIKSSLTYFKNSLGTVISPIIQMIQPILTALLDGLAEINNLIGELFSAIAGKDYFAKATKGAEDYAESLKKVKNQALGIDELNVLQADNEESPFEQASVGIENNGSFGGFLGDFGATLKEFIGKLKESLMPVIEAVSKLFEAITPILNVVVGLLDDLFSDTMDGVSNSIASFIGMVAEVFTMIGQFLEIVEPILDIANQVFGIFLNLFNSGLKTIFETIAKVVSRIFKTEEGDSTLFAQFLEKIVGGVVNIITWVMDIANILKERFKKAWKKLTGDGSLLNTEMINYERRHGTYDTYATGGFVEDGFFYANHTELVGQFSNGKTAVANNEQITEGIYRAVLRAMSESGGNDSNREIVVKIDNRELGRAVDKYERQKGFTPMYNGGKGYGF